VLSLCLVRHAYAKHPQLNSTCLLADFCYNAWRKHISLNEGISGTSKGGAFVYVIVAAYPSLLAKLKLSRLCALLLCCKDNKR
jgi:hypothetical protein